MHYKMLLNPENIPSVKYRGGNNYHNAPFPLRKGFVDFYGLQFYVY